MFFYSEFFHFFSHSIYRWHVNARYVGVTCLFCLFPLNHSCDFLREGYPLNELVQAVPCFLPFSFGFVFHVIKWYKILSFSIVVMREMNRGSGFRNGKYGKLYIDYFSLKGLNALGVWIDIVIFLRLYLIFGMWLYTGVIYEYGLVGRLYFFKHDVMVSALLAIWNSHVFHIESILLCLKALGGI